MFYTISDRYIDYLSRENPHVMSNKPDSRTYHRKYIGLITEFKGYTYFVPMSSPKDADYLANGEIKKDSLIKIYMRSEYFFIKANRDRIEKTADRLYKMRTTYNPKLSGTNKLMEITLDFAELEKLCDAFRMSQSVAVKLCCADGPTGGRQG